MRAVIQRVSRARVIIDDTEHSRIDRGLLVLLGVEKEDQPEDAQALARRVVELRIFEDEAGKMNRAITEVDGSILAVSQFTLLGDCRKGRRRYRYQPRLRVHGLERSRRVCRTIRPSGRDDHAPHGLDCWRVTLPVRQ